jgi:DNA invertase Pin-like site-specific DNA recombinase
VSTASLAQVIRILIYLRVSKADQLEGYSPDAMEARCREKAAALGGEVVGVLLESGKGNNWNLPKLNEALRLAETGAYDVLLSYDTSRLARDSSKRKWVKRELDRHTVVLRYATIDFADTPEGRLQEGIIGDFDEYEREKIGMRTANGIRQKLDDGEVVASGRTPYGFARVYNAKGRPVSYTPQEPEASVVRRIVTELATRTLTSVCDRLNADGVPTPRGAALWLPATLRAILRNTSYVGEYRFGQTRQETRGGEVVTVRADDEDVRVIPIPAIVTRAEIAAARQALGRRKHDRRPRCTPEDDAYVLRGLVRCDACGGVLSTAVNNGFRRYVCLRAQGPAATRGRCDLPQVPAEALESLAWDRLKAALDRHCLREDLDAARDGDEAARRHRSQVASLKADLARCERRIEAAVEVKLESAKGSTAWAYAQEKQAAAEREKAEAEVELAGLERAAPRVLSDDVIAEVWAARDRIVAGLLDAEGSAPARRRYLRTLGVAGTVRLAADGEAGEDVAALGRRHRFAVGWTADIGLSGSGHESQGIYLLWDSTATTAPLRLDLARHPARASA